MSRDQQRRRAVEGTAAVGLPQQPRAGVARKRVVGEHEIVAAGLQQTEPVFRGAGRVHLETVRFKRYPHQHTEFRAVFDEEDVVRSDAGDRERSHAMRETQTSCRS